jgi:hypothetical protein
MLLIIDIGRNNIMSMSMIETQGAQDALWQNSLAQNALPGQASKQSG